MSHNDWIAWSLAGFGVLISAWIITSKKIIKIAKPSYKKLLEEKARLDECIWSWKYPDGSIIPQHKRQRMFRDLYRVSRKIRSHPDHPDNKS